MSYNHAGEWLKFTHEWEQTESICVEAGMPEESIRELYQFENAQFNRDRAFRERAVSILPFYYDEKTDDATKMTRREWTFHFEDCTHSKELWIEDLDTAELAAYIRGLSQEDKDILTMFAFEKYKQKEIAEILGITPSAVNQRIKRIKRNIKNILDNT